jgi:hypothetical protein
MVVVLCISSILPAQAIPLPPEPSGERDATAEPPAEPAPEAAGPVPATSADATQSGSSTPAEGTASDATTTAGAAAGDPAAAAIGEEAAENAATDGAQAVDAAAFPVNSDDAAAALGLELAGRSALPLRVDGNVNIRGVVNVSAAPTAGVEKSAEGATENTADESPLTLQNQNLAAIERSCEGPSYVSAYMHHPVELQVADRYGRRVMRDVRQVRIELCDNETTGRLWLDGNVCEVNRFGDRVNCTLEYYPPIYMRVEKAEETGGRIILELEVMVATKDSQLANAKISLPKDPPIYKRFSLVVPKLEKPAAVRLIIWSEFRERIERVMTLERCKGPTSPPCPDCVPAAKPSAALSPGPAHPEDWTAWVDAESVAAPGMLHIAGRVTVPHAGVRARIDELVVSNPSDVLHLNLYLDEGLAPKSKRPVIKEVNLRRPLGNFRAIQVYYDGKLFHRWELPLPAPAEYPQDSRQLNQGGTPSPAGEPAEAAEPPAGDPAPAIRATLPDQTAPGDIEEPAPAEAEAPSTSSDEPGPAEPPAGSEDTVDPFGQ